MGNHYSPTWFDTFLPRTDPPPVDREVAFIARHLPRTAYPCLLDVACGIGRHVRALAGLGYEVVGIDVSVDALAVARDGAPNGVTFRRHDIRELDALHDEFDGVLCLWQSFGAFDDDENRAVLAAMARRLRPGGRLLLDVYHRDALATLPTVANEYRRGREVRTTRTLEGRRFRVRLSYSDSDDRDEFEWQVFTPGELVTEAASVGLSSRVACAWFDEDIAPSTDHVRMQLLFERPAIGVDAG